MYQYTGVPKPDSGRNSVFYVSVPDYMKERENEIEDHWVKNTFHIDLVNTKEAKIHLEETLIKCMLLEIKVSSYINPDYTKFDE